MNVYVICFFINIDQDDVETFLAEFVKQFEVKAKLVVPIIQEIRSRESVGKFHKTSLQEFSSHLWGLLIAHQCSQTRQLCIKILEKIFEFVAKLNKL